VKEKIKMLMKPCYEEVDAGRKAEYETDMCYFIRKLLGVSEWQRVTHNWLELKLDGRIYKIDVSIIPEWEENEMVDDHSSVLLPSGWQAVRC